MENRARSRALLAVTLVAALLMAGTVLTCAKSAGDKMTRRSFDDLTSATKQLAKELCDAMQTDQVILSVMADLIAEQETGNVDAVLRIMNSFDLQKTRITNVELLLPDGRLLCHDGTWHDATGQLDFAVEREKGAYISDRIDSVLEPGTFVLSNAAPVVENGEVVAILYGVIPLQEMSRTYSTNLYNGKTFVLIIDGSSGDILLDTWHDTLGNISDLGGRKMLKGFSYAQAMEDIPNGRAGDICSVSRTTGNVIYLHYEPVGINNWSVTLGVSEEDAMASSRAGVRTLYLMAVTVSIILLGYLGYIIWYLVAARRDVYRISTTDPCTGLINSVAYGELLQKSEDRVFSPVACIYIDANGLHEINNTHGHEAGDQMLRTVASCLRQQFPADHIYRIGGDEFVVFTAAGETECEERMQTVAGDLTEQAYSISYGIAARETVTGLRGLVREADSKMLEKKRTYYTLHDRRQPRR